jgi:23S rRNA pseudouridine955/2504/2580 synthase
MPGVQHVTVTQAESGQKLLQYLNRLLGGQVPRSALLRWIRTGQVRVESRRSKPFQRVRAGERVRIPPYRPEEHAEAIAPAASNPFLLSRVFEDGELLVLAKPPGLATQPGSKVARSVTDFLEQRYAGKAWMPSLVHRLDKDTSGLLLVAKTYGCLQRLQRLWTAGGIEKMYLAWVEGETQWQEWTRLEDELVQSGRSRGGGEQKTVRARCSVRTLRNANGKSLLAVSLHTGRKHQIRIQLARRMAPVLGDRKYGKPGSGQGLLLHAYRLAWEERSFCLDPPWIKEFALGEADWDILARAGVGEGRRRPTAAGPGGEGPAD